MTKTDLARRVYNHAWKLDPIIRSLLDTDFYKLLMQQMIWQQYDDVKVEFSLINRTKTVGLPMSSMKASCASSWIMPARCASQEGDDLAGGKHVLWPQADFLAGFPAMADRLPPAGIPAEKRDGQYELTFSGPWRETTMWEIPALAIINELRSRAALKGFGRFELDVLYARAKARMWTKVEALKQYPALRISDFGTRRRHSFLWQRWCVEALKEGIGEGFSGTSTCCSPWIRISKRSAPMRMSCRWSPRRWPRRTPSCPMRPIRCLKTGVSSMAATC